MSEHHEGCKDNMIMVGDFGRDQDDEKALIMAIVMRRIGASFGSSILQPHGTPGAPQERPKKGVGPCSPPIAGEPTQHHGLQGWWESSRSSPTSATR